MAEAGCESSVSMGLHFPREQLTRLTPIFARLLSPLRGFRGWHRIAPLRARKSGQDNSQGQASEYFECTRTLSRDLPSPNNPDTAQNGDINVSLNRDDQQAKAQSATPEHRLWYAMIGAPAIPISLFWMAWTDHVSHQPFVILDREVLHVNRYT